MGFEIQDKVCSHLARAMECSCAAPQGRLVFGFAIGLEIDNLIRAGELGLPASSSVGWSGLEGQ